MAKVTPILRKSKTNADGHSPIYLRIHAGGKTRYKSLSVYLHPRHWNEKKHRVRKSHRNSGEINVLISKKVAEAEAAILKRQREGKPILPRHVKRALSSEAASVTDFFAYAKRVREHFQRQGQIHSFRKHRTVLRKFKAFAKAKGYGSELSFVQITPDLLRAFETYLIEECGNARTTVASNFRVIRAILYRAIREGLAKQGDNPFFHFQVKRGTPDRRRLTLEQLRQIEGLDLPDGSLIWHVKNYFLFAIYGGGIRFGDVARLKRKNIIRNGSGPQRLVYTMDKTGHPMDLRLVKPAQKIVAHYLATRNGGPEAHLFPILDGYDTSTEEKEVNAVIRQTALVNKYLKKLAARAEVDVRLSTHVARHSFASIALRRGWDVAEISERMGHAGGLKVTEAYLEGFDGAQLDDKMDDLFGGE